MLLRILFGLLIGRADVTANAGNAKFEKTFPC